MVTRRQFLAGAGAGVLAGALSEASRQNALAAAAAPDATLATALGPGLNALASRKGLFFGSAIEGERMSNDAQYSAIVAHECGSVTPEGALQWKALQPAPDAFAFERMDGAFDWALENKKWLRGHSVLWHEAIPPWAAGAIQSSADFDRLVAPYIEAVAGRYGSHLRHWDVLNEALDPDDGRADGLRSWQLSRVMGEDYVIQAFHRVHEVVPQVKLYYNDYGFEYGDRQGRGRRLNLLRALERWLKAGAALSGVGMQGHLETRRGPVDGPGLSQFLSDLAGLGLDIVVSELDVREHRFDSSIARRDQIVSDHAEQFLDVVLDQPRVRGVVSWGLSDKYSWLSWNHDSQNRGLMYDDNLMPKPLRWAIAKVLTNAPHRPA